MGDRARVGQVHRRPAQRRRARVRARGHGTMALRIEGRTLEGRRPHPSSQMLHPRRYPGNSEFLIQVTNILTSHFMAICNCFRL